MDLEEPIDRLAAESSFSGVVRGDVGGEVVLQKGYGLAHRGLGIANNVDTRLGLASGAKVLTALAVASLIEDGTLALDTTARSLLGSDLPLIDDRVTVQHLLAHRSGIGDYLDESQTGEITDYVMPVPVHQLSTTEEYLSVLEGHTTKTEPDTEFAYCNGGFVVLALLAERAAGTSYYDLVEQRVCAPAGMSATAFLRSDELDGNAAIGYLFVDGLRTNVLHLPVRGCGDGGVYSTVADVHALWAALFDGRIVSLEMVERMVQPQGGTAPGSDRYGLGFWLHATTDVVMLEGYDAGVSFRTVHDRHRAITHTVIANWSDGAWPITHLLDELLAT